MDPQQQPVVQPPGFPPQQPRKVQWPFLLAVVIVLVAGAGILWWVAQEDSGSSQQPSSTQTDTEPSADTPAFTATTVLAGREHIWDIAFLPTGELIFTERSGKVSVIKDGAAVTIADIDDVRAGGEGGLMGLAVDPQFAANRYVYTCFNTTDDIRVVRWKMHPTTMNLESENPIITGMPRNPSGRHSGCRIAFGPDGFLWVGTGDTAQNRTPQTPQDPKSLGGKILRVDRDGKAVAGNMGGDFDKRIYSYGHRNTQGLAFFAKEINGVPGISAEHGPGVDDEVNVLKPGNFGWAPPDGPYDESVPMTDTGRFPDAVEALWESGSSTLAPSGAAILQGSKWKAWDGAVAVAMLKTQHLRILLLDDQLKITKQEIRLADEYGRLRAVTQGPDGALYLGTSNGNDDKIIRLTPQ